MGTERSESFMKLQKQTMKVELTATRVFKLTFDAMRAMVALLLKTFYFSFWFQRFERSLAPRRPTLMVENLIAREPLSRAHRI
jgi:hypothetical protein